MSTRLANSIDQNKILTQQLIKSNDQLIIANRQVVDLANRLANIAEDVISKLQNHQLLHSLMLHKIEKNKRMNAADDEQKEFVFTRCQRRSLENSLKRLQKKNPNAMEVYRNGYMPNSVNILNCVKDALKESKINYKARSNIIQLIEHDSRIDETDTLVNIVKNIINPNVTLVKK